jgi:hypothetical protein
MLIDGGVNKYEILDYDERDKNNKIVIRFTLEELKHVHKALESYIYNFEDQSHPDMIIDDQQRI